MRFAIGIFLFLSFTEVSAQFGTGNPLGGPTPNNGTVQKPEFYKMDWEVGTLLTEKPVPISIAVDSLGQQDMVLLFNEKDEPRLYTSDISTPVCADGECRLMHIGLYWDLLGGYAGFDRHPALPLTKHDHDEFLFTDYLKLHQLLQDDNSILRRKEIDELVKKPKVPEGEDVDAVAGATISEVKESVVEGALYSCYTAWHLVHGAVKEKVKKHTLSLLNDDLVVFMLNSKDADYQLFALKELDGKQYEKNYQRIAEIFEKGIPLVRTFIIKNLPESFWGSEKLQKPFWDGFAKVDINSRSLLLGHLNTAPESVVKILSGQMNAMTKNQLKVYLDHLETWERIPPVLENNLRAFSSANSETYAYLVTYFLEDRR